MPSPTLDVSKALNAVGVTVQVGTVSINWAHDLAAFGGDKEQLDATPLVSPVRINKSGIEDRESWTVEYFHNNAEFVALTALKGVAQTAITVTLPDGATFTNTGTVTGNYMTEVAVNSMLTDKLTVDLDSEWSYTAPSP